MLSHKHNNMYEIFKMNRFLRFSVAPMMDWTDRHCRYFHRLLSKNARLYSEMVTTGAVIHGDRERLIGFDPFEKPLALQLGGSDPHQLAQASQIAEDYGYDEVNLNVGCPSDRVQNGRFGACLMLEPDLVADCVSKMKAAVSVPVTVKCRIGVDDQNPPEALEALVSKLNQVNVNGLIVHARKAWLKGLSPKENRDIPPLDYELVHLLKQRYPHIPIALNGGLQNIAECVPHLKKLDGVMLGRAAYHNPEILLDVDPLLFGCPAPVQDAFEALEQCEPYIATQLEKGVRLHAITRHLVGLFHGKKGARLFRQRLSECATKPGAGLDTLRFAVEAVK